MFAAGHTVCNRQNAFAHFLRRRTEEHSRSSSVDSCQFFLSRYQRLFSLLAPKLRFECRFRRYLMSPSWSLAATHTDTLAHYGGFWPHECVVNWWLSLAVIIAICSTGVRKKEREKERKREMLYARWEAIGLAVAARWCAIYVDYGHSNVIPHRLFHRPRNAWKSHRGTPGEIILISGR